MKLGAFAYDHGGGFTLVELLVIVSIIGFISSTIVATVNTAKKKAQETVEGQAVGELAAGLLMYYDKYGQYPNPGDTNIYCLADYSDNKCGLILSNGTATGIEDLNLLNTIREFIAVQLIFPRATYNSSIDMQGPVYGCNIFNGKCVKATIEWDLQGVGRDSSCTGASYSFSPPGGDLTVCQKILQ